MLRSVVAYSEYQQFALATLGVSVSCQIRRIRIHLGIAHRADLVAVAHDRALVILVVNTTAIAAPARVLRQGSSLFRSEWF